MEINRKCTTRKTNHQR